MKAPNYIRALAASDIPKPGKVSGVLVLHDEWCEHFRGRVCNCNPVVKECAPAMAIRLAVKATGKN